MVVAEGPKIVKVECILEGYLCLLKIFLFLSIFSDYISFSFYLKYIWKKCCKNVFGRHFGCPYKRYQNTSGCDTTADHLLSTCIKLFHKIKRSGTSPLPHLLHKFWRKIFLLLYSIKWPNFIVCLPLLCEILSNMCIEIV